MLSNPLALIAEITHRCPLHCVYCSNPIELASAKAELPTNDWLRVFSEAAKLGVLHVHLTGGEPLARGDLHDLIAGAHHAGLYTNLITSGIGLSRERLKELVDIGLDHIQLSFQDSGEAQDNWIAGTKSHARKIEVAGWIKEQRIAFTANLVVHRQNLDHLEEMISFLEGLRPIRIDSVVADYYARYPKPCMGGWGRQLMLIDPAGRALPCHAAGVIPELTFDNVREHSLEWIWQESCAFQKFRGESWMPEPCRSCDRRAEDFGGCRCQALLLTGDASATDPACSLAPSHLVIDLALLEVPIETSPPQGELIYRANPK